MSDRVGLRHIYEPARRIYEAGLVTLGTAALVGLDVEIHKALSVRLNDNNFNQATGAITSPFASVKITGDRVVDAIGNVAPAAAAFRFGLRSSSARELVVTGFLSQAVSSATTVTAGNLLLSPGQQNQTNDGASAFTEGWVGLSLFKYVQSAEPSTPERKKRKKIALGIAAVAIFGPSALDPKHWLTDVVAHASAFGVAYAAANKDRVFSSAKRLADYSAAYAHPASVENRGLARS